jgi:hypothetical protein
MTRGEKPARLGGALLCLFALEVLAFTVAVGVVGLGVGSLIVGLLSWLRAVDVAFAWASTLGGMGLIGGGIAGAAFAWLALGGVVPRLGDIQRLRYRALSPAARTLKFMAAIGILLALICLPFAAAILVGVHA